MAEAYPLHWPAGRPRWRGPRELSKFKMTESAKVAHLYEEIERLGGKGIVVSTNRAGYSRANHLDDPGVAVYFKYKAREVCIAADRYLKIEDNLHAVGLAVEAIRGMERWGTGDMVDAAFSGFAALPEAIVTQPPLAWHEVLEVPENASVSQIKAAYKAKAKFSHPDAGGNSTAFTRLQRAYEEGLRVTS